MIDFVRSWQVHSVEELPKNYNGLHFEPNGAGGYVMSGSIHKFRNGGKHNADDFSIDNYIDVWKQLHLELGINPYLTPLNGFEFGVNIKLPYPPKIALKRLILHKSNTGIAKKEIRRFDYNQYAVKIYNKSDCTPLQNIDENLLRLEVRIKKMQNIKNAGITTFSDLFNPDVWQVLASRLINEFSRCLFVDLSENEVEKLTPKEYQEYVNFINPRYWEKIQENKMQFSRIKKRCEEFCRKKSSENLSEFLAQKITQKCAELRDVKNTEMLQIYHLDKWLKRNITPPAEVNKIYCLGCGAEIVNPRKGQKFCSAKQVGYERAHKCRNNNSNPRNNTQRAYARVSSIPMLFEDKDYIQQEKRIYLAV